MATRFEDDDATIAPSKARTPASSGFTPGVIVAGRYRLAALLGRGGMGEVYRADDLTLDQPVALKFLPAGIAADDARLAQFHNELRIARQVSHKNVVRLYDLGDADGRRFLTMEYVDGEDLASLLRRIGRVPEDKAVELARQLCAGVSAAHERGVLHRDLKPANVMIDGDGNVRITDFGIATTGGDGGAATAGTPQYMAPEQLLGRPASIRSDIYALGLILFEIFTGRRAYDVKTLGELKQLHDTGTVTTPSSIVRDLDPAVERVILRCLEKDAEKRPGSALAVAAALPGGDPLAAALAAGETPSPAMLIAAGEQEALGVRRCCGGTGPARACSCRASRGSSDGRSAHGRLGHAIAGARLDRPGHRVPGSAAAGFDLLPGALGYPPPQPVAQTMDALTRAAVTLSLIFDGLLNGLFVAVFIVLGSVMLRLMLRRTMFATAATVLLLAIVQAPQVLQSAGPWWIAAAFQLVIGAGITILVVRYGLLVTVVAIGIINVIGNMPLTLTVSHCTAITSNLVIATVIGIAAFGFFASRAGQPLFGELETGN